MQIQNNLTEGQPAMLILTDEDSAADSLIENALFDTADIDWLIKLTDPFGTN